MKGFPIIDKLGGRKTVYAAFKDTFGPKAANALRVQEQRGRLTSSTIIAMMDLAEQRGLKVAASDFVFSKRAS